MESCSGLQRTGHGLPTYRGVFIAEAALESPNEVSAILHIIAEPGEQRVTGDVERWDENYLVVREVGAFRKDEIDADVRMIEDVIHR
jgi:hypothetical protein